MLWSSIGSVEIKLDKVVAKKKKPCPCRELNLGRYRLLRTEVAGSVHGTRFLVATSSAVEFLTLPY
jgi:hypothetical protein